ncbi:MAG: ArsA family ATPase [Desulfobacteraceae bacterium]|jgi:anion-transporting  ArsA/GET3 family ATPase|nr:ArsA family ATPase [Desulfobacteraceae bacterium]
MTAEHIDASKTNGIATGRKTGSSVSRGFNVSWLDRLLSRRLIFVMGKGGVGKTTVSVILANIAERMNKKVLLVELGDTDSIGRLYRGQPLTEVPCQLSQSIWGARVNSKAELQAYVRAHVVPKFIAGKIIRSRLFEYLFEAAPGLKEVMSLGRLWRWEKEEATLSGSDISGSDISGPDISGPTFDLILVDAPATGHALSLLRLPELLINMIRVGPLANQIKGLQRLFKNHQKTSLVLVSLPEELPVNETIEFYSMAKEILDMPVAATFINCVYPSVFSQSELKQFESIKTTFLNRSFAPENLLIASAERLIRRNSFQKNHMKKIYEKSDSQVLSIPFRFTNDLTLSEIRELSLDIQRLSNPSEDRL